MQICNKAHKQLPEVSNMFALRSKTAGYLKKRIKFSCIVPEKGPNAPPAAFHLPKAPFQFQDDGYRCFSATDAEETCDKLGERPRRYLFEKTNKCKQNNYVIDQTMTEHCTGGEVKGKLANGVGSQYSHATSERGISSIPQADAHTSAASSRLN